MAVVLVLAIGWSSTSGLIAANAQAGVHNSSNARAVTSKNRISAPSLVQLGIGFANSAESTLVIKASPGTTHRVPVVLRNKASKSIQTRTYAANPITVTNGGFVISDWGTKPVGATRWVDYPSDTFNFSGSSTQNRTATINIPRDAQSGEYVVGLAIQNAKPVGLTDKGGIQMGQIRRQSIAVRIDVPGPAKPAVAFGGASYTNQSGKFFTVALAAENTGNRILRSEFLMTLKDGNKNPIQTFSHTMSGFYTETATKLEMRLEKPLPNGEYYVDTTMTGGGLDAPAVATDVPFTVDDQANEDSGGSPAGPIPLWVWVALAIAVLAIIGLVIWLIRRRRERAIEARAAIPQPVMIADVLGFLGDRALGFRGDPVGRLVVAKVAGESGGLGVVTGGDETALASDSARSVSLRAIGSFDVLGDTTAESALVTSETLDQANAAGDSYQGPATLIAVADPEGELEAIETRFLYNQG